MLGAMAWLLSLVVYCMNVFCLISMSFASSSVIKSVSISKRINIVWVVEQIGIKICGLQITITAMTPVHIKVQLKTS